MINAVSAHDKQRRQYPSTDKVKEAFNVRLGANMVETNANSVGFALLDRNDGLQTNRGVFRSNGVAFHVFDIRHGRGGQAYSARRQVRQGGMRPQEGAPNYRVVAAWAGFMLFIGAGAFAIGMTIRNEAHANHLVPQARESSIYYCATGEEMPLYEPCRDRKDQRDI